MRIFERLQSFLTDNPWVGDWLTPIWLVGLGAALGLVALLVIFLIAGLLSRIPLLGGLFENTKHRWIVVSILTLVFLVPTGVAIFSLSDSGMNQGGGADSVAVETVILKLILLIPTCFCAALVLVALISRRTISELPLTLREGVMRPIGKLTIGLAVFGLIATSVVQEPRDILSSVWRLPYAGTTVRSAKISPLNPSQPNSGKHTIEEEIVGSELQNLKFSSDQPLEVVTEYQSLDNEGSIFRISAGEDFLWNRNSEIVSLLVDEPIARFVFYNLGSEPANVTLTITRAPAYPQVSTLFITAISVVLLTLLYILQSCAIPRISAVALATAKSEIAQPMFLILNVLGMFLLIAFIWIPYNTFGEDIKMLKDSGLPLIMVLAIIQAVWAASMSVSEEVEGRTALTVLSKPVRRQEFILGKFLGIFWTVGLMFIFLGLVFMFVVSYKMVFDSGESANIDGTWQSCYTEMIRIVPGLALAFMETIVLAAISVAISTRLPMLANFSITGTVYVLGNLTPLIVQSSSLEAFGMVQFFGRLIATVFPNLEIFNVQAAVVGNADVPLDYLGWVLIYSFLFGTIAMLFALVMFEDRDLA